MPKEAYMSREEIDTAKRRICDAAYELGLALNMDSGEDAGTVMAAVYEIASEANGDSMTDQDIVRWREYLRLLGTRAVTVALAATGDLRFTFDPSGEPRYYAAREE
jgi:hypothetical protein